MHPPLRIRSFTDPALAHLYLSTHYFLLSRMQLIFWASQSQLANQWPLPQPFQYTWQDTCFYTYLCFFFSLLKKNKHSETDEFACVSADYDTRTWRCETFMSVNLHSLPQPTRQHRIILSPSQSASGHLVGSRCSTKCGCSPKGEEGKH